TRYQSVGLVVAMLVGGAIYDPGFINAIASALRFPITFTPSTTLRFPVYLNLVTAVLTLITALSMREPNRKSARVIPNTDGRPQPANETALQGVLTAGAWIAHA